MTVGATDRQHRSCGDRARVRACRRPGWWRPGAALLLGGLLLPAAATPARAGFDLVFDAGRVEGPFLGDADVDLDQASIGMEFGGTASRFVVTVPYVRVSRTGLVIPTPEGPAVVGAGGPGRPPWQVSDPDIGESGVGDALVSLKNYLMKSGGGNRPTLTLDVDYKWATADEEKGLGSGENDWGAGLDYTQPIGKRLQILGRATYRFTGSPEGVDFEDRLFLRAGFGLLTAHTTWRLLYDTVDPLLKEVPLYDPAGAATGLVEVDDTQVVRGEMVFRNNAGGSMKIWALAGLNDSSPDLGFGLTFASRTL